MCQTAFWLWEQRVLLQQHLRDAGGTRRRPVRMVVVLALAHSWFLVLGIASLLSLRCCWLDGNMSSFNSSECLTETKRLIILILAQASKDPKDSNRISGGTVPVVAAMTCSYGTGSRIRSQTQHGFPKKYRRLQRRRR